MSKSEDRDCEGIRSNQQGETILYQGIILPNIIDLAQVLEGKQKGEENLTIVDAAAAAAAAGTTIP